MRYTKHACKDCGRNLGYKLNDSKDKRCQSCRNIFISKNPQHHPSSGRAHKDRSKFRKNTFNNVNYEDRIKEFSPAGSPRKKYRMSCAQCGSDRGYQLHTDALRLCKTCRDSNVRKYSKEQKRIRCCMKANLAARLKKRVINKNKKSTFDILNYTVDALKEHLENLFYPNPDTGEMMTWDNYGANGWEIDHKTPDSLFVYNSFNDDGFKKSWALENLQPMWAKENRCKGNRI